MVGGRDLSDQAIDRPNFDQSTVAASGREGVSSGVGMGQYQNSLSSSFSRHFGRERGRLVRLPATGRCLHYNDLSCGPERLQGCGVTHN